MNKRELRKLLRSRLLPAEYMTEAGKIIAEKVLELPQYRKADSVFCYLSTDREPSTEMIMADALKNRKVYVPKCISDHEMLAVRIFSTAELKKNAYGISEPEFFEETETVFDLIIVPCMAAGKKGERLGHGRGYYDRFLKTAAGNVVCLCFEKNIREDIEMDDNDIRMPCIITENKTYEL